MTTQISKSAEAAIRQLYVNIISSNLEIRKPIFQGPRSWSVWYSKQLSKQGGFLGEWQNTRRKNISFLVLQAAQFPFNRDLIPPLQRSLSSGLQPLASSWRLTRGSSLASSRQPPASSGHPLEQYQIRASAEPRRAGSSGGRLVVGPAPADSDTVRHTHSARQVRPNSAPSSCWWEEGGGDLVTLLNLRDQDSSIDATDQREIKTLQ